MSEKVTGQGVELDPEILAQWVSRLAHQYGGDLQTIVFPEAAEPLIQSAFFKGRLNDVCKYDTDSSGTIRMYLAGVKVMFTDRLPIDGFLLVIDGHKTGGVTAVPAGPSVA